jgi:hypothetical protein
VKRTTNRPENPIGVSTYMELETFAEAFAEGKINLLILIGAPGLQKSRLLRKAAEKACVIQGTATPFGIYRQLWQHCDQLLILDDLDRFYANATGVQLLKSLCQTEAKKTLAWHSNTAALVNEGIPVEFATRSKVAIIANSWAKLDANVQALEDRGHVIVFEPPALEVHRRTAKWFWDQEIFDFVGEHLHLIAQPSMRHYVAACELKTAKLPWRPYLLGRFLTGKALEVAKLKANRGFATEMERWKAFVAAGHGNRATYFNQAKKLKLVGKVEVPTITLTNSPPAADDDRPDLIGELRSRYGTLGNG